MMGDDVGIDSRERFEAWWESTGSTSEMERSDCRRAWQACEADALERAAEITTQLLVDPDECQMEDK